jgi:hypothetical protein
LAGIFEDGQDGNNVWGTAVSITVQTPEGGRTMTVNFVLGEPQLLLLFPLRDQPVEVPAVEQRHPEKAVRVRAARGDGDGAAELGDRFIQSSAGDHGDPGCPERR